MLSAFAGDNIIIQTVYSVQKILLHAATSQNPTRSVTKVSVTKGVSRECHKTRYFMP